MPTCKSRRAGSRVPGTDNTRTRVGSSRKARCRWRGLDHPPQAGAARSPGGGAEAAGNFPWHLGPAQDQGAKVVGARHARVDPAIQETAPPTPRSARRRAFLAARGERALHKTNHGQRPGSLTCSTEPRGPQPNPVGPPLGQERKPGKLGV